MRKLLRRHEGFFDADHYLRNNLYLLQSGLTPLEHYIRHGSRADLAPNGVFDAPYYRSQAAFTGTDAASHYLTQGWRQGLHPHKLFEGAWYRQQYRDVEASGEEPLSHYLRAGWKLGYNPHPMFDGAHYLYAYDDVAEAGAEPFQHYLAMGAAEARRPNALFKPDYYIQGRQDVKLPDALQHFYANASAETRDYYDSPDKIRVKGAVGRIDDYARITGQRVIDVPTETRHSWPSPAIINRDRPRTMIEATLPQPYVAVLKDVTAFPGTRLLLTGDGHILHDELASPRAPSYHDKLKAIGSYSDGVCTISAMKLREKIDKALVISSDTDFNYYHLLIEALPKLTLAEQAGCPADVPLVIQENLHPNLVEALTRVAGERRILYLPWGSGVEVGELWFVGDMSRVLNTVTQVVDERYDIVLSPIAVRDISHRLAPNRAPGGGTRKIYMSRNSHYRLLGNQAEFMAMIATKGFEVIDTGAMTLQEQIDAMADVALIIAPTGAALTNLLWCRENLKVLILVADHPQMNLNIFNHVGEPLGAKVEFCMGDRLHQMPGEFSVHDNFEVDLDVIAEWCDRQSAALS